MSIKHHLNLLAHFDALYQDELRELCEELHLRSDGVTNMLSHPDVDWSVTHTFHEGFHFHFMGQTCVAGDAHLGKDYTTFVVGDTLHVLYTARRKQ